MADTIQVDRDKAEMIRAILFSLEEDLVATERELIVYLTELLNKEE